MNPTPEERIAAARARLAELAEKFTERTRGEIEQMRGAAARLTTPGSAALGEILHLAHRITGTGATLGFEAVSGRAHELEQLVAAQLPDAPCEALVIERIRGGIEALAAQLAASGSKR